MDLKKPSFDEESISSSETLLKEQNSMEACFKDFEKQELRRKRRWVDWLPSRRSVLIHLIILFCYVAVFGITMDHLANQYRHGPDYTYCEWHSQ